MQRAQKPMPFDELCHHCLKHYDMLPREVADLTPYQVEHLLFPEREDSSAGDVEKFLRKQSRREPLADPQPPTW
jgi:hypothetical protein